MSSDWRLGCASAGARCACLLHDSGKLLCREFETIDLLRVSGWSIGCVVTGGSRSASRGGWPSTRDPRIADVVLPMVTKGKGANGDYDRLICICMIEDWLWTAPAVPLADVDSPIFHHFLCPTGVRAYTNFSGPPYAGSRGYSLFTSHV